MKECAYCLRVAVPDGRLLCVTCEQHYATAVNKYVRRTEVYAAHVQGTVSDEEQAVSEAAQETEDGDRFRYVPKWARRLARRVGAVSNWARDQWR